MNIHAIIGFYYLGLQHEYRYLHRVKNGDCIGIIIGADPPYSPLSTRKSCSVEALSEGRRFAWQLLEPDLLSLVVEKRSS